MVEGNSSDKHTPHPLAMVVATGAEQGLAGLCQGLLASGRVQLHVVDSLAATLSIIGAADIDLVVVDNRLADCSGLTCVQAIAAHHPLVNCMLVSDLPAPLFHEQTEGLGILMQLPNPPTGEMVSNILATLATVQNGLAVLKMAEG